MAAEIHTLSVLHKSKASVNKVHTKSNATEFLNVCCDSSVGRALDRRFVGLRFNLGSRNLYLILDIFETCVFVFFFFARF